MGTHDACTDAATQVSFQSLLVLSLKGCKLRGLAQDVAELRSLRELYLENNLIMALPDTFTRLWALEVRSQSAKIELFALGVECCDGSCFRLPCESTVA